MSDTLTSAIVPPRVRGRSLELILPLLLAVAIAAVFWNVQRYPALLKKLHAGTSVKVAGSISFDALLPVVPAMPVRERVARTSVNWLWTNRYGMYFALPFAAAVMTGLARIQRPRQFRSPAVNILCGAVAGAPAGVCTNCATPIAQGLLLSGASTRLTLAALISSPSFNPVVLAMLFVLFPLKLAALRVAVPLVLLFLLPWLVEERTPAIRALTFPEVPEALSRRLSTLIVSFLRNLLRITLLTLPWMLAAAVLGAVAAEVIPAYGTHLPVSLLGLVAVAIFGTLLPVPMAFDVALVWVLFHAGVPVPYVAVLLCTLGVVSIYSLSALGQQLGRAVPLRLAGAAAALGVVAGLVTL